MNPVTKVLNGGGGGMSEAASVFWGRLVIGIMPVLLVATGTLAAWVIEIRASIYTIHEHTEHMALHADLPPFDNTSNEVLRELERINQRLAVVEAYLLQNPGVEAQ
jgi:hypothetical protein